MFMVVNFLVLY